MALKLLGERLAQARATAEALLDELELGSGPVINSLLKAKRLARLMADDDAQTWLDLEARGYPPSFSYSVLGNCVKYARAGGRITHDDKYYFPSLPQFEADLEASRLGLQSVQFPTNVAPSVSSSNPGERTGVWIASAVQKLIDAYTAATKAAKASHSHNASMFNGLKSALHNYATDSQHALLFSDVTETLFEKSRDAVDKFVRSTAPRAAGQIAAAFERFDSGDPEALTHALTSCRRLMQSVADAVFPAQDAPFMDSSGKPRKVGPEEYKNRLMAFFDTRLNSSTSRAITHAELEATAARVDALYEKACKGVHVDVTAAEVRLVLLSVYLLLAEVVLVADAPASRVESPVAEGPRKGGKRAKAT